MQADREPTLLEENSKVLGVAPRFAVTDSKKALKFYRQLGFQATYQDENFIIVSRDGIDIHLNVYKERGTCSVCWLRVAGIEALYEHCRRENLVRHPLETKPYGLKQFAVSDPFGNLILIAEPIPGRKP